MSAEAVARAFWAEIRRTSMNPDLDWDQLEPSQRERLIMAMKAGLEAGWKTE